MVPPVLLPTDFSPYAERTVHCIAKIPGSRTSSCDGTRARRLRTFDPLAIGKRISEAHP